MRGAWSFSHSRIRTIEVESQNGGLVVLPQAACSGLSLPQSLHDNEVLLRFEIHLPLVGGIRTDSCNFCSFSIRSLKARNRVGGMAQE